MFFDPPSAPGLTPAALVDELAPRTWFNSIDPSVPLRVAAPFFPWEVLPPPAAAPPEHAPPIIRLRLPGFIVDAVSVAFVGPNMTPALLQEGHTSWGVVDSHFEDLMSAAVDVGGLCLDQAFPDADAFFEAVTKAGVEAKGDPRVVLDLRPEHIWRAEAPSALGTSRLNIILRWSWDVPALAFFDSAHGFKAMWAARLMGGDFATRAWRGSAYSPYSCFWEEVRTSCGHRSVRLQTLMDPRSFNETLMGRRAVSWWNSCIRSAILPNFLCAAAGELMDEIAKMEVLAFGSDTERKGVFLACLPRMLAASTRITRVITDCSAAIAGGLPTSFPVSLTSHLHEQLCAALGITSPFTHAAVLLVDLRLRPLNSYIDSVLDKPCTEKTELLAAAIRAARLSLQPGSQGAAAEGGVVGSSAGDLSYSRFEDPAFLKAEQTLTLLLSDADPSPMQVLAACLNSRCKAIVMRALQKGRPYKLGDTIGKVSKFLPKLNQFFLMSCCVMEDSTVHEDAQGKVFSASFWTPFLTKPDWAAVDWYNDFAGPIDSIMLGYVQDRIPPDLLYKSYEQLDKIALYGNKLFGCLDLELDGDYSFSELMRKHMEELARIRGLPPAARPDALENLASSFVAMMGQAGQKWNANFQEPVLITEVMSRLFLTGRASVILTLADTKKKHQTVRDYAKAWPNWGALASSFSVGPNPSVALPRPAALGVAGLPSGAAPSVMTGSIVDGGSVLSPQSFVSHGSSNVGKDAADLVKRHDAKGVTHADHSLNLYMTVGDNTVLLSSLAKVYGAEVCPAALMSVRSGLARLYVCDQSSHPDHASAHSAAHNLPLESGPKSHSWKKVTKLSNSGGRGRGGVHSSSSDEDSPPRKKSKAKKPAKVKKSVQPGGASKKKKKKK